MEYRKMELLDSLSAKVRNKSYVDEITKNLLSYYADVEKKERKNKHLCRYCYYIDAKIGGFAITTVICANCDKEMSFKNTCVDVLCNECAEKLGLCKRCGQKMD